MIRVLALSALALIFAPLAASLWPLLPRHIGAVTAIWSLGALAFFFFMVGVGLPLMWLAGLLVPFFGLRPTKPPP